MKREKVNRASSVAGSEIDYGVENTPARPGSSKSRSSARPGSAKGYSKKSLQDKSATARSAASSNARKVPPSIITRAGNIITNVKKLVEGMAVHFQTRPLFILQFLAFLIGFLVVLSRRDVKDRLKRILGGGWQKVRQTAGMGVKVSYI